MQFLKNFEPQLKVNSPGRINLIGEHTDYNMGYVLPAAIDKKISFEFQANGTLDICNIYSSEFEKGFIIDLSRISKSNVEWENYILGVLHELSLKNDKLRGFDCIIQSNLPKGAGLSSSAALECGLASGLNTLFDLELDEITIIKLCQRAEHDYVGTQCGIMDQFATVMGKTDHVIQLDCKSLEHSYVPLSLENFTIVMLNTNVTHNLATSAYNERKRQCEDGVRILSKSHSNVKSLRDVNLTMLEQHKELLPIVVYQRCKFVIEENDRVLKAIVALKEGNLETLGKLLYESHEGIQYLYEVSCDESDFLVEYTRNNKSVLGARQVGGGFGGCTLNLVKKSESEQFIKEASQSYKEKFGLSLTAFEVHLGNGTTVQNI